MILTNIAMTLGLLAILMFFVTVIVARLGSPVPWYNNKFDEIAGVFGLAFFITFIGSIVFFIASIWI